MTELAAAPPVETRRPMLAFVLALAAGGLVFGLMAGQFVTNGRAVMVLGLALVLLPVAIWKRPALGPPIIISSALFIDQFPEIAGQYTIYAFSARIPLFHGLGGYRPSDLLLGFMIIVYFAKRGTAEVEWAPRTPLRRAMKWFQGFVVFAILYGVGTGGLARVALTEARPFLYIGLAYVIASTFITTRRGVRAALWAYVIGSGLKALQELAIFFKVRNENPRPDAILGHEESFFFGMFLIITLALWLYRIDDGRLRKTATWLVPFVLLADLTNHRRVAWLILPFCVIVAIVVGMRSLPTRRKFLTRLAIGLAAVSVVYFPAYWNKTGSIATPARAFHSAISPDPRDAASNLYRVQEDQNLKYNIRMNTALGRGFGHAIVYALPIVDISDIDPYIAYIPHNGIWWIYLRLGYGGAIAFWCLLGVGIITACRLARERDKHMAVVGMILACALPAYALLGYNDQGFFYYRVGFVLGALLGLAEAARRLVTVPAAAPVERGTRRPAPTPVAPPPPAPAPVTRPRVVPRPVVAAVAHAAAVAPSALQPAPALAAASAAVRVRRPSLGRLRLRRTSRTGRRAQLTAVVALPFALGLLVWLVTHGDGRTQMVPTSSSAVKSSRAVAAASGTRPATQAHVVVTVPVAGKTSRLEARLGSPSGRVIYDGVIGHGASTRLSGTNLWLRFGTPQVVAVTVNGKPASLSGATALAISTTGGIAP